MTATLFSLTEQFANLVTVEQNNGNSLTAAAKNIRKELKKAFPGVVFSVKCERYSGGDSIRVYWVDGPTTDEVTAITSKYEAGSFDGMEDIYNYETTEWTKTFGDAKYVFENRSYSDSLLQSAIDHLQAKYACNNPPAVTVEDFKQGRLYNVSPMAKHPLETKINDHWSYQQMIRRYLEGKE